MNRRRRDVPLCTSGEVFPEGTHACLIYSDDPDRRLAIGPYLSLGIASNERASYLSDSGVESTRAWLTTWGLDVRGSEEAGLLEVLQAEKVFSPSGVFAPDNMLDRLRQFYLRALGEERAGARVTGEMSWVLRGVPGSNRLIEFEAMVNTLVETHPITCVCQYDARRLDGATLLDTLRVHPMIIVRGQVVKSPYYMRPEEFLARSQREDAGDVRS